MMKLIFKNWKEEKILMIQPNIRKLVKNLCLYKFVFLDYVN